MSSSYCSMFQRICFTCIEILGPRCLICFERIEAVTKWRCDSCEGREDSYADYADQEPWILMMYNLLEGTP